MKKRILALALAMCMLVGLLPATVLAEGESSGTPLSTILAENYDDVNKVYSVSLDAVQEITVDKDTVLTSPVNVTSFVHPYTGDTIASAVTIDLNGYRLTAAEGTAAFRVEDDCTILVRDRKGGGIVDGTIAVHGEGANGGYLLSNVRFTNDPTGYAGEGTVTEANGLFTVDQSGHTVTFVCAGCAEGENHGTATTQADGTIAIDDLPEAPEHSPWGLDYNFFYGWTEQETGCGYAVNGWYDYYKELHDESMIFNWDAEARAAFMAKAWAVWFYDDTNADPNTDTPYAEVKTEEFDAFADSGIVPVESPANPTREGYTFGGWYTQKYDDNGEPMTDAAGNRVLEDDPFDLENVDYNYDVYAKWTPWSDINYSVGLLAAVDAEGVTTTVTVTDEDGNTVEGTTETDGYTYFDLNRAQTYTMTFSAPGYTTVTRDTATVYDNWGMSIHDLIDLYGAGKWTTAMVLLEKTPVYVPPSGGTGTGTTTPSEEPTAEPTTTTTTDESGNVTETTETVETVENEDGSTVTTTTTDETVTDAEGNVLSTTNAVVEETTTVDEEGNETVTTTTTTTTEHADGMTATTVATDGVVTEASVTLPETESTEPVTLPIPELPADSTSETAATITVSTPAETETTIEIPVTAATAGTIVVLVHEDGTEEIVNTTTMSDGGVKVTVSGDVTVKVIDNTPEFGDVGEDDWHEEAVVYATARGIFNQEGTGEGNFDPEGDMTRAMVFTTLARFAGVDTEGGETWYEKGMEWAVENNISDGTNHDDTVTREQLVTMLYRLAGEPETTGEGKTFTDSDAISDWAADAMKWATEIGLIGGYASGDVRPTRNATRAEVATIFMRFIEATAN